MSGDVTSSDGSERPVMSAEAVESALWSAWARQTATCLRGPEDDGQQSPNWPHPTKTFWEDAMSSLESRWETIRKEHRETQTTSEEPVQEELDAFA
jgi:hypothetical protein